MQVCFDPSSGRWRLCNDEMCTRATMQRRKIFMTHQIPTLLRPKSDSVKKFVVKQASDYRLSPPGGGHTYLEDGMEGNRDKGELQK